MIFVTVGTQEPFDRLIRIIDDIAPRFKEELIVQSCGGRYFPRNISTLDFITPAEFSDLMERARLVVSHAGMGTIISAMEMHKPIVIFPRKASLGEHRNEHQMATAQRMHQLGYVHVAFDRNSLISLVENPDLRPLHSVGPEASPSLVDSISSFIG